MSAASDVSERLDAWIPPPEGSEIFGPTSSSAAAKVPDMLTVAIVVNGASRDVPVGMTMPELLTELGLGVGWVLVELNGTALLRKQVEATVLASGDVLELVRAIAGG